MKTIMVIGIHRKKKYLGKCKVLFSRNNLLTLLLKIFKSLLIVKIGIQKWESHTKGAIFCMVPQELVRVLLPRP